MMQHDSLTERSRSLRKSLRNVSDSREDLRRRRSNAKTISSTHQRNASSASSRGQHFRVGNVASNGHIYLRPAGPAPPLNSTPLTPPDSPQAVNDDKFSEEPWRESFVSRSEKVQIVVKPPTPAVNKGRSFLDTSIPHFRIGRPRFTEQGSAILTDSYVTGDSSHTGSRSSNIYSLRHYANMFPAPPRTPESPEFRPRTASSSPEIVKGHGKNDDLPVQNTSDLLSSREVTSSAKPAASIRRMFGSIRRALSQKRVPRATPASGPVSAWRRPSEALAGLTKPISMPLQSCTWLNCACPDHGYDHGRDTQSRDQPTRSLPHTPFNELETGPSLRMPIQNIRTSRSVPILNLKHLAAPNPTRVTSNVTMGSRSIVIFNDTDETTPIEPRSEAWLMPPSIRTDSPTRESEASQGSRLVPLFLESASSTESRPSEEHSSQGPRSLRRRPGGNLKLARNVHDLEKVPSPSSLRSARVTSFIPKRSSSMLSLNQQQHGSFYLPDDPPSPRVTSHQHSLRSHILPSPQDSSRRETFFIPSRSSSILRDSFERDLETAAQDHSNMEPNHQPSQLASAVVHEKPGASPLAIPSRSTSIGATQADPSTISSAHYSSSSGQLPPPLLAKGTYEAELLRLAELPDEGEEDGGVEAALRRLEGRVDDTEVTGSATTAVLAMSARDTVSNASQLEAGHQGPTLTSKSLAATEPAPVKANSFLIQHAYGRPTTAATSLGRAIPSFSMRDRPETPKSMTSLKHSDGTSSIATGGTSSAPNTPQVPQHPSLPPVQIPRLFNHARTGSETAAPKTGSESGLTLADEGLVPGRSSH